MSEAFDELKAAVFIVVLIFTFLGGAYANKKWTHDDLIEQCESELPRNQKCVLVAQPEEAEE